VSNDAVSVGTVGNTINKMERTCDVNTVWMRDGTHCGTCLTRYRITTDRGVLWYTQRNDTCYEVYDLLIDPSAISVINVLHLAQGLRRISFYFESPCDVTTAEAIAGFLAQSSTQVVVNLWGRDLPFTDACMRVLCKELERTRSACFFEWYRLRPVNLQDPGPGNAIRNAFYNQFVRRTALVVCSAASNASKWWWWWWNPQVARSPLSAFLAKDGDHAVMCRTMQFLLVPWGTQQTGPPVHTARGELIVRSRPVAVR